MLSLLILSSLGVVTLFSEIVGFKKFMLPLTFVGLIAALIASITDWNTNHSYLNDMMVVDNYSIAFTSLMIVLTILWFMISPDFFHEPSSRIDHFSLIIFALIGAQLMTSFSNMIMLFLAIEILSIPMYILAGSNKSNLESNEAALKYFLMGAFATGFLLFGIALIYGASGSFNIHDIAQFIAPPPPKGGINASLIPPLGGGGAMIVAGVLLMLIGIAFKASVAPFHFWAPDVYTGSPTVVTAFMSTVIKVAAFAGFFRLFYTCFNVSSEIWNHTIWILAAVTILIGNITAVYQNNFKRLLAYSSIAHAGYMLLAILAIPHAVDYARQSLLFYAVAYSVSSLTAFALLLVVSHYSKSDSIESFNGLAKKNPLLAIVTVLAMLSLAGIPPMAGFFAKYYIFTAALQQGYVWLVVIAILGSLIGVYYYFRIIVALFKSEPVTNVSSQSLSAITVGAVFKTFLIITSLAILGLGIAPQLLAGIL